MVGSPAAREDLLGLVRAWVQMHGAAASLAEAEQVAEEVARLCGQAALEATFASLSGSATYRGARLGCSCGSPARFVGYRRRWLKTLSGEATVERAYYHCSGCRRGQAPWDQEQGINGLVYTPRVKALVARACARLPYRDAVGLLSEAGVLWLEESSAEAITQEVGGRLRAEEAAEEAVLQQALEQALAAGLLLSEEEPAQRAVGPVRPVSGERLYATLDAAKAHTDGAWHDVKVGALYTVRPNAEGIDRLFERTYVASQRPAEAFGWQLRTRAALWNQPAYAQTVVIADGADYNWGVAQTHFAGAVQILDFFHAAEHVYALSRALYRQEDRREKARGEHWARAMVAALQDKGPERLLRSLRRRKPKSAAAREALRRERGYFRKNRHRMDYPAYRRQGMMIGSGPVEAACKSVVVQRMKQSGMRWSSAGADRVLAVRTALLSQDQARIQRAAMAA